MKTLYRKGTVHPSPAPETLAFLPAAILTLASTLTEEDREVLSYLLSCSGATSHHQSPNKKGSDHPSTFNCNCFRCYMTYWVRWDSSPNRQLIHEIIDAFEDSVPASNRKGTGSRNRGCRRNKGTAELPTPEPVKNASEVSGELQGSGGSGDGDKGSVRKLVNFIGERIWNVWG